MEEMKGHLYFGREYGGRRGQSRSVKRLHSYLQILEEKTHQYLHARRKIMPFSGTNNWRAAQGRNNP